MALNVLEDVVLRIERLQLSQNSNFIQASVKSVRITLLMVKIKQRTVASPNAMIIKLQ